jgi:hypothetical protein
MNSLNPTSFVKQQKEKSDPTIDIHLSILGQKIKINKMFYGYTDLVNLIWKLPTKHTSLFNINFLINDQNEYVYLLNGMILRIETIGAVSFDLSGSSDISFWNMYAKINLKTKYISFFSFNFYNRLLAFSFIFLS